MKNRNSAILPLALVFLCTWLFSKGEEREPCPETGTSADSIIKQAYDCHGKFLDADLSISHGFTVLKELFNTTFEKGEEEGKEILAMADTAFISLISQKEVRQEFKNKLTGDGKAILDTLKIKMDASLQGVNDVYSSAKELAREIPDAIKKLPSELKGLRARKIPSVKSALDRAKAWMDEVIEKSPVDIEKINSIVQVVQDLTSPEE